MYCEAGFTLPSRLITSGNSLKDICDILNIKINYEKLNKLIKDFEIGEGEILVFHNVADVDTFIFLDCYRFETDQLDTFHIAIRCKKSQYDLINSKLDNWHDIIWKNKTDCVIHEYRDDDLKKKAYDEFNRVYEENRNIALEWHKELIKHEWYINKTTPEYLLKQQCIHQPIRHYYDI